MWKTWASWYLRNVCNIQVVTPFWGVGEWFYYWTKNILPASSIRDLLLSQIKDTYIAPKKSHFTNTQKRSRPEEPGIYMGFEVFFFETSIRTRWAPSSYKWGYNPPIWAAILGWLEKKIRTDGIPGSRCKTLNLLDDGNIFIYLMSRES